MLVSGSSAVEFFFVLAGFLIAMSAKRDIVKHTGTFTVREAHAKALDFVKKKLKAIYPILIIVLLLWLVLPSFLQPGASKLQMLQNTEWEWLLLVGTPFGLNNNTALNIPMWFLTALIVIGYIYTFVLYKHYDFMMFAAPVIGVLFYVYFALNSTTIFDHAIPMGFLNAGMVRAIAEMSLGVSMFSLYEYLKKKNLGVIWRILLSLLEVYAIYRFFALTLWQPVGLDNFRRLVYVMIIVLLSFLNVTGLTWVFNNRFSRRLGSISLAMYLSHYIMIPTYFKLLQFLKMRLGILSIKSPLAKALREFVQGTGGFDEKFKPIPMTWKDMLIFTILVVAVSILIMLLIAAVKKFIIKPCLAKYKKKQAEKTLAAAHANRE